MKDQSFLLHDSNPFVNNFRFANGNHGFMMVHMQDTGFRDSHSSSDCVIYFEFCHSGVEMETRKLSWKLKNVYMGSM